MVARNPLAYTGREVGSINVAGNVQMDSNDFTTAEGILSLANKQLEYRMTTLTAAQIRAMETTPIEVVPAVSGSAIVFEGAVVVYDVGATASFDDAAADGNIEFQYVTANTVCSLTLEADGFIDSATDKISTVRPLATDVIIPVSEGIEIINDGAAFTGATADGVLDVHVWYRVVPAGL